MRRKVLIGLLGLVALVSCSVKEDRSDCPCWLTVEAPKAISLNAWFGSHQILDNHRGGFVDHTVPRGIVEIIASYGKFAAEEGHQMDSLFAQRALVNTDGETAGHTVRLNKNFTTVELDFKDEDDGLTVYDLLAIGTVSGVDERTLEPVEGIFRHVPDPVEDGRGYAFRVPRQKDNSLALTLSYDGNVVEVIDLGYLIARSGFDWKSESLGDVSILCDLPAHTFTITVKEWEGPVIFDITI